MSYKTILVHLDESPRCATRLGVAALLARRYEAHVIGVSPAGMLDMIGTPLAAYEGSGLVPVTHQLVEQRARKIADAFEADMRMRGITSFESRVVDMEAIPAMADMARSCDLIIVGQTDPGHPVAGVLPDFPQQVMLHARRPVLIVPYAGSFETIGREVLIAWSPRHEAARAMRDALPLLQRAEKVRVVAVASSEDQAREWQRDVADALEWLGRHGVKATSGIDVSEIDVGNALLSRAADPGVDLIVMGGYGHTRLREFVMGGATRTLLATMTLPVLMSH